MVSNTLLMLCQTMDPRNAYRAATWHSLGFVTLTKKNVDLT